MLLLICFRPAPCCVTFFNDKRIIKIVSGAHHCLALTSDCKVSELSDS